MDNGKVSTTINNGIAVITFYHPKSNSLPGELLNTLAEEITAAGKESKANVIVIKSEGDKAFCAGASFDELLEIKDFETGKRFFTGFAKVINAVRKCPKFVIARIQGKTVGGGVGIASAADYTFAYEKADIKLSELALGIGPFVVGPAVERKIGTSGFGEMSIDYDWRSARWAESKGLYNKVFSSIEELDNAVNQLAEKLAKTSPEAMAELKKILWKGTEDWDELLEQRAEISGRLVLSDFTKNYIESFKQGKK